MARPGEASAVGSVRDLVLESGAGCSERANDDAANDDAANDDARASRGT